MEPELLTVSGPLPLIPKTLPMPEPFVVIVPKLSIVLLLFTSMPFDVPITEAPEPTVSVRPFWVLSPYPELVPAV